MAKTWTIVAAAALALLLVASVVVAVLESEEPFEAGTAEAAVQDFLRAVADDEFETVYGFLSAELREECSVEQVFASPFRSRPRFGCGAPKTVPEVSGPDPSLPVRGPDPGLPVRTPEAGTVPVREK